MKNAIAIAMLLALGAGVVACGSGEKKPDTNVQQHPEVPAWYTERADQNPAYVYGYGESSRHSNRQSARMAAEADARAQIALYLAAELRTRTEVYIRSLAGVPDASLSGLESGIRQQADAKMPGMRFDGGNAKVEYRTHPDGGYDVFVRGWLDVDSIRTLVKDLIQNSSEVQAALEKYNVARDEFFKRMNDDFDKKPFVQPAPDK